MAELQIVFLGDFRVTLGQIALTTFQTDKIRALLVYLISEGRAHQRADLAQLLWPGYSEESARNSLRQALHHLRQLLHDGETDPPWLLLTRQTIQINPAASLLVDVLTFRRLLAERNAHTHPTLATCVPCLARLRQATALYQGDFLANFTVADSDPFEEWRRITQEQLHIQMLDALSQLAIAAECAGNEESAIRAAQRQLTFEPWLEVAHRQIMRLLAKQGLRAAAIAQYQRCRQVLAEELGVSPDAETLALFAQIQSGHFEQEVETQAETLQLNLPVSPSSPPFASPVLLHNPSLHNLPAILTAVVGRSHEVAEVVSLLRTVRLLTLVGPGGMGKTRLALEVGRQQLADYPDGVVFVSLAALTAPSSIASAIAAALSATLGLSVQSEPPITLYQFLQRRRLLLILDNFEHLLVESTQGVELVSALLQAAPAVQILVTSRERLQLRAEQLYHVQPLTFSTNATLAEATFSSAAQLFVQSAQLVQAGFQLTTTNLTAVLRICQLVQGMPLGLELAAAQVAVLPLRVIANEIEQRAEFLTVDWYDLPERQRSMRAVFAWSWQLLTPEKQRILRQLSVFQGGFDLTAAQSVTGTTLPVMTSLIHKSLLQWQAATSDEGRYAMHDLLRQFAAEELTASGERAWVEEQHGRYYLAYLAARGLRLGRRTPKEASAEIQAELDNVRQAWQWALAQGRLTELDQSVYAWWQFCQFQGLEFEGRQHFALAVAEVRRHLAEPLADETAGVLGQRLLAKLLAIHANYLFAQGCNEEMAAQAREAVLLGVACGGFEGETFGTFVLGRALQELEQKHAAGEMWRQTIQLVRLYQPNHPESELLHEAHWMAYNWLRGSALHFGDYSGSRTYMVQALQICQTLGKRWGELYCLAALAGIDFFLYGFAAAELGFAAALDLAHSLSYRRVEMVACEGLSGVFRLRGDYTQARTLLDQAISMAAELAFPYDEALFLAALIRLHCQLGGQAAAAQRLEQLTQLLARVKLAKECRLYGYLAAAIKAHYAGATGEALRYAEQADQLNKDGDDILFRLVDTALILGHIRTAGGQWAAATTAFQEALATFQQFGNQALAAEPRAGLAQIALAQGDLVAAQAQVEAILPVLAEHPHAGYNTPFAIYLTCYHVLTASADPRAGTVLQRGYDLLQQIAANLDDTTRQHFLEVVPVNRDLVAAFHGW